MRAILLILILIVVAAIIALATGLLDINTIRGVKAPAISANGNGVTATGGQTPTFDVRPARYGRTGRATVPVPTVGVNPAERPADDPSPLRNRPLRPSPRRRSKASSAATARSDLRPPLG